MSDNSKLEEDRAILDKEMRLMLLNTSSTLFLVWTRYLFFSSEPLFWSRLIIKIQASPLPHSSGLALVDPLEQKYRWSQCFSKVGGEFCSFNSLFYFVRLHATSCFMWCSLSFWSVSCSCPIRPRFLARSLVLFFQRFGWTSFSHLPSSHHP